MGGFPLLAPSLAAAGLSESAIAAVFMLFPLGKLVTGPAFAWWVDRSQRTVRPLVTAMALAASGAVVLAAADSPLWLVVGMGVLALALGPVFPIADALTVSLLGEDRRNYGRIRAAGSVSFIGVVVSTSALSDSWEAAPRTAIAVLLAASVLATATLPDARPASRPPTLVQLWHTARSLGLVPLLVVATLHGATLSLYDRLFALHTTNMGISEGLTGLAIGAAVVVEVGILWQGRALLEWLQPRRAMTLAVGSTALRWAITALAPAPVVLTAQLLHGLTYALFWVAGVALFAERAPRELTASVQTLLVMSMFGLGPFLAMALAAALLPSIGTVGLFLGATVVSIVAAAISAR